MALYKINRGPKFGQQIHLPNTQEVALALALGDIELVESGSDLRTSGPSANHTAVPPRPKETTYVCTENRIGRLCVRQSKPSGEVFECCASPDQIRKAFPDVPENVVEQYRLRWEQQQVPVGGGRQ